MPDSFPINCLPSTLRRFVPAAARSIGCCPSMVALPSLGSVAGAIGATRSVEVKPGWAEPSLLWCGVVAVSGSAKSPAQDAATGPTRRRQALLFQQYKQALAELKSNEEPPICERVSTSDTTAEALAPLLLDNPKGLTLIVDELTQWLGSFDQYRGGKGTDVGRWLSIHRADSITVDRKIGPPKTVYVPKALVSVVGTIQPAILQAALSRQRFADGFAARLLLAMPESKPRQWTESTIPRPVLNEYDELFDALFALDQTTNDHGDSVPLALPLDGDAQAAYIEFFNAWNKQAATLDDNLRAAWAKLEGTAARLALIHHVCETAHEGATSPVTASSMAAGIELAKWFGEQTKHIYGHFKQSAEEREQSELIDWLKSKGGAATARDLQISKRREFRFAQDAELALTALVQAGLATIETLQPPSGRPATIYRLRQQHHKHTTPENTGENDACVVVCARDTGENGKPRAATPWEFGGPDSPLQDADTEVPDPILNGLTHSWVNTMQYLEDAEADPGLVNDPDREVIIADCNNELEKLERAMAERIHGKPFAEIMADCDLDEINAELDYAADSEVPDA